MQVVDGDGAEAGVGTHPAGCPPVLFFLDRQGVIGDMKLGPQKKWHGKRMNTTIHACRKHTVYVIPAFETYGNLKEAAAQVSWAAVCVDTPSRP